MYASLLFYSEDCRYTWPIRGVLFVLVLWAVVFPLYHFQAPSGDGARPNSWAWYLILILICILSVCYVSLVYISLDGHLAQDTKLLLLDRFLRTLVSS